MFNSFSIGDWLQFSMEQEAKEVYGMKRRNGFKLSTQIVI